MQKPVTPADFYTEGDEKNLNKPFDIPEEKTSPQEEDAWD